jgi:hypothetical protein
VSPVGPIGPIGPGTTNETTKATAASATAITLNIFPIPLPDGAGGAMAGAIGGGAP